MVEKRIKPSPTLLDIATTARAESAESLVREGQRAVAAATATAFRVVRDRGESRLLTVVNLQELYAISFVSTDYSYSFQSAEPTSPVQSLQGRITESLPQLFTNRPIEVSGVVTVYTGSEELCTLRRNQERGGKREPDAMFVNGERVTDPVTQIKNYHLIAQFARSLA